MPKLRTPPETPAQAKKRFCQEIRVRRAYENMTQKELADEVGISPPVMSSLLGNPDKITIGRMRTIVTTLKPDMEIVLKLLGYPGKDIDQFRSAAKDNT